MKIFFRRIHLYLSLGAGLVILTACATGAILVFEKELQMAFNKSRYYVAQTGRKAPVTELVKTASENFPDCRINSIKIYSDAGRSAEINFSAPERNTADGVEKSKGPQPPQRQPGFTIFLNPYTGGVLEKYSYRQTFSTRYLPCTAGCSAVRTALEN